MDELPEPLREQLQLGFDQAQVLDLHPEWHDDEHGFDYDCISCRARGDVHRCSFRFISQPIFDADLTDTARGPAG